MLCIPCSFPTPLMEDRVITLLMVLITVAVGLAVMLVVQADGSGLPGHVLLHTRSSRGCLARMFVVKCLLHNYCRHSSSV